QEALGLYVSSHPLQECAAELARALTCGLAALPGRGDGELVTVGGLVGAAEPVTTRRRAPMVVVRRRRPHATIDAIMTPGVRPETSTDERPVRLRFGDQFRVDSQDRNLMASLKALFGERCVA